MADNRPLFDDEDLPDWLKKAGITFAGPAPAEPGRSPMQAAPTAESMAQPSSQAAPEPTAQPMTQSSDSVAWGDVDTFFDEMPETAPTVDVQLPDWMQQAPDVQAATPASISDSDLPPWMQSESTVDSSNTATETSVSDSSFDDLPMPDFTPDWQAPGSSSLAQNQPATGGNTSSLPWRQGASDPNDQGAQSGSGQRPGLTGALPWRSETNTPITPGGPTLPMDDLSWLNDAPSLEPESSSFIDAPESPVPPQVIPPTTPLPPIQPEAPPAPRGLRSLVKPTRPESAPNEPDAPRPPAPPLQNFTPAAPPRPTASTIDSEPPTGFRPALRNLSVKPPEPARPPPAANLDANLVAGMDDWLNGFESTPATESNAPQADLTQNFDTQAPWDFLSEPGAPDTIDSSQASEPDYSALTSDAADLDWMADFAAPEAEDAVPAAQPQTSPDSLSDFLSNLRGDDAGDLYGDLGTGSDSQSPTASEDDSMLDWLNLPDVSSLPTPDMSGSEMADIAPASIDTGWLRDLTQTASAASSAPMEAEAGTLPDWLSGMSPAEGSDTGALNTGALNTGRGLTDSDQAGGAADLGDIPDWMRDMSPAAQTPIAEPTPTPELDWLEATNSATMINRPTGEFKLDAAELPDWLSEVQPGQRAPDRPRPAADRNAASSLDLSKTVNSGDIDALLNLPISESKPSQLVPIVSTESATVDFDLDDLDQVLGPAPTLTETPELSPAAAQPAPELDFFTSPSQLAAPDEPPARSGMAARGRQLSGTPAKSAAKPRQPAAAKSDLAAAELPEFISDLRPSDEAPLMVGSVQVGIKEVPLAQLTDQLRQLRERARQTAEQPAAIAASPTAGPLSEINGILAPVGIKTVSPASTPAGSMTAVVSDLQARRVKLIQNLLEIEQVGNESALTEEAAPTRVPFKLGRFIITVILLLTIVAPFMTNVFNLVAPPDVSKLTVNQAAVASALDALKPNQPILIAFEYGPTGSGELDDLARTLLRDVLKKGGRPIIVSTNPSGVMHAEALMSVFGRNADELALLNRTGKPLLAPTDYVVLRYLPSGAAGVRSVLNAIYQGGFEALTEFFTDVQGQPSGFSSIADVQLIRNAPIVVLAETPDDVRNWAEQYRVPAELTGAPAPKIILGAAAEADATARTYSAALPNTIIGPLIGLRDATIYRAVRQPPTKASESTLLQQRWQSTGMGALVAALIIFLGSIFNMIRALRRRRIRR